MVNKLLSLIKSHYSTNQYPTLHNQIREWSLTKEMKGLKILDATPIFRNTCVKYIPLLSAGAELTVAYSDVMPYDPNIVTLLKSFGIEVLNRTEAQNKEYDIILDCAGAFSQLKTSIGYVELTRSGVEHYMNCEKPVFVADSGKIKQIETCLGTGESFFRAMKSLGYTDFKNKNIVVIGSGKVGRGVITYSNLHQANAIVITEKKSITEYISQNAKKVIYTDNPSEIIITINNADFVITATGVNGAVESIVNANSITKSKAIFANMGVEDEWGATFPERRVLNKKQPLNFILDEPTNMQYIETTMALHNYGALHLIKHNSETGIIDPPKEIEDRLLEIVTQKGIINQELSKLFSRH